MAQNSIEMGLGVILKNLELINIFTLKTKTTFCENTIYPYVFENIPFFSIFFKNNRTPYFFKIIINFGSNYKLMVIFSLEL
jgi:hypothetical protein